MPKLRSLKLPHPPKPTEQLFTKTAVIHRLLFSCVSSQENLKYFTHLRSLWKKGILSQSVQHRLMADNGYVLKSESLWKNENT